MLASAATLVVGCSMPPVHVKELQVSPPALMVSKKVQAPLYLVLDDARVPDYVHIPETDVKELHVYEVQTFVTRDLKRVMELFFARVEVVPPSFTPPTTPHYVAQVQINALSTSVDKVMTQSSRGGVAQTGRIFAAMDWGFALRAGDEDQFMFSFANKTVGDTALVMVDEAPRMFTGAFDVALRQLVDRLQQEQIDQKLLATGDAPSHDANL
jgi:hypothetical protein